MAAPGGRPRDEVAEQIDIGEPDGVAAPPALDDPVGDERQRDEQQEVTQWFAAAGLALVVVGAGLAAHWFNRFP